jgi:hypothetical protein
VVQPIHHQRHASARSMKPCKHSESSVVAVTM